MNCRRLDVPTSAATSALVDVPAGMALALTDLRAFCDRCEGRDFQVYLYGQAGQALTTPSFELAGAGAVADWHGAGPFLVVLGGARLKIGASIPANRGDESVRVQAAGYLTRADHLGQ